MLALLVASMVAAGSCANPSIISAKVQSATMHGTLRHYTIAIVVKNIGNLRQPGNLLQSLDVLQNDQRVGKIGLQPLAPGQSQKVTYGFDRSPDAGAGTTNLLFKLDFNGRSGNDTTCHGGKEAFSLTV
jgi:hypothetical protein